MTSARPHSETGSGRGQADGVSARKLSASACVVPVL